MNAGNAGNIYVGYNGTGTFAQYGQIPGYPMETLTGCFYVGYNSGGTATISSGTVSDVDGYIGYNSGWSGSVTVDATNSNTRSTWANSGDLCVGYGGTGTLAVSNGGSVSSSSGYIGYLSGARAR